MTLPSSGQISISAIQSEFSLGNNLNAYRAHSYYLDNGSLGNFSNSNIDFNQFHSKRLTRPTFSLTIGATTANINLRSSVVAVGWNQLDYVVFTVASGVVIGGNGIPALTISGSFPNGLTVINNGAIVGYGGRGGSSSWISDTGAGSLSNYPKDGQPGGAAIAAYAGFTLYNYGTIAGGGGGGGQSTLGDHAYWCLASGQGGGGAGYVYGAGGNSYTDVVPSGRYYTGGGYFVIAGITGQSGSYPIAGLGSTGAYNGAQSTIGYLNGSQGTPNGYNPISGGNGGSLGSAGQAGQQSVNGYNEQYGAGGAAGYSIGGYSYVTVAVAGDIRGPTSGYQIFNTILRILN